MLFRSAVLGTGGAYPFPLGLKPNASTTAAEGFQGASMTFAANTYGIITGYFQKGSDNTVTGSPTQCGVNIDAFSGTPHGEWVFTPSTAAAQLYDMTIYPQDFAALSPAPTQYFITKDNAISGSGCGSSVSSGLTRTGFSGFSEFGFAGGSTPLPIRLLSFEGKLNGNANSLYWQTATEENSAWHVVERSVDGATWQEVGRRKGAANSSAPKSYYLNDEKPLAKSYYRLVNIDADGSTQQPSQIIVLERQRNSVGNVSVYPIPTTDYVKIEYNTEAATTLTLTIADVLGRTLNTVQSAAQAGLSFHEISLSDYADGTYFLFIDNGSNRQVTKLVKSK